MLILLLISAVGFLVLRDVYDKGPERQKHLSFLFLIIASLCIARWCFSFSGPTL